MNQKNVLSSRLNRRQLGGLGLGAAALAAAPNARPAAAQDRTKITVWGEWSGEGEEQIRIMIDAFNEAQDQVEAEYVVQQDMVTKFLTGATSGQTPDVLVWDRWQTTLYASRGVLHSISDRLDSEGIAIEDFYEEAVRELTYEDQVYGLPLTVDARALFYNRAHLEEAGIEPPTTWDELKEAASALTKREDGKLMQSGFTLGDVGLFSMYHRQAGGTMLTEDGTKTNFNNEQGLSVLQLWQEMMDAGVYEIGYEAGLGEGTDAFVTGRVSMTLTGPWMIRTYQTYGEELDFGVVPPPAGPNGDQGSVMGGFGLVIAEQSSEKDAAWEFVKWWLADPENTKLWGESSFNIPGNRIAAEDEFFSGNEHIKGVLDTLEFATIRPTFAGYSPMEVDALIPNLQLFMEGSQSAEESLQRAQEDGDRILSEYNV